MADQTPVRTKLGPGHGSMGKAKRIDEPQRVVPEE